MNTKCGVRVESKTPPASKWSPSARRWGLLLLERSFRYAETGTANVPRLFQFVLVASAGGQLPVGRMYILLAVLHVAWLQRALLRDSAVQEPACEAGQNGAAGLPDHAARAILGGALGFRCRGAAGGYFGAGHGLYRDRTQPCAGCPRV